MPRPRSRGRRSTPPEAVFRGVGFRANPIAEFPPPKRVAMAQRCARLLVVALCVLALAACAGDDPTSVDQSTPDGVDDQADEQPEGAGEDGHDDDQQGEDEHAEDHGEEGRSVEHGEDEHGEDEHGGDEHDEHDGEAGHENEHGDDDHDEDGDEEDGHDEDDDHDDEHGDPVSELGAHEHGAAALTVAWIDADVVIDLISPGFNVFGFEHEAVTDEDRAVVADRTDALSVAEVMAVNTEAGCTLTEPVAVEIEMDGSHSELTVSWMYACDHPDEIRELDATQLFAEFPNLQDLDAQWISASRQSAAELSRSSPVLRLEP